jgi:hypothetical protein
MKETLKYQAKDVFGLMDREGIRTLVVEYDGCGDAGSVERIHATGADGATVALDDDDLDLPIRFVHAYLDDEFPGWGINDGSFGEIVFTIDADGSRKITTEHKARFMDYDLHEIGVRL